MKVETYEAISIDEQQGDVINELVSEEALALVESLGLEGQKTLAHEHQAGGETVTTRNPYRRMTKEEQAVFSSIMPTRTKIEKYRDSAIPLRVLQVASHAIDLFDDIEVWHPEAGKDDPVLVGLSKSGQWGATELFLLARWGEELCSLDELRAKAVPMLLARARRNIADAKGALQRFESGIEEKVADFLQGGAPATEFVSLTFTR